MVSSLPSFSRVWPVVLRTRCWPSLPVSVKVALAIESFTLVAAALRCIHCSALSGAAVWALASLVVSSAAVAPSSTTAATCSAAPRGAGCCSTKAGLKYSTSAGTSTSEAAALTAMATMMNSASHRCTL